jgi:hypothetical protein
MSKHHIPAVDVTHLAAFDTDGALQEAADRVNQVNRRSFLRGTGAVVAGGAAMALLPGTAWAQGGVPKGDVAILNYALTLEYLESAFYKSANGKGALSGEVARFAKTVGAHEDAHVTALKKALGSKATKKPSFDFQGTTDSEDTFKKTAIVLEDTGVKAYQGQAPNIKTPAILRAAISIHPVEARHAAWIRNLTAGQSPAPDAFNPAADMATVLAAVKGTGFITAMASASAGTPVSGQPSMTG